MLKWNKKGKYYILEEVFLFKIVSGKGRGRTVSIAKMRSLQIIAIDNNGLLQSEYSDALVSPRLIRISLTKESTASSDRLTNISR